jgi:[acyl-carrier-protein] S-malonyltransferase
MSKYAFLFPGQGSQTVGMGQTLALASSTARAVLEEVDESLGLSLSRLMREGPLEALTLTQNAQPAIMAASMAVVAVLEREANFSINQKISYVAGHSLGEYSALCAAGALSLGQTARLLQTRGEAMQAAAPVGVGAMAAMLGMSLAEVEHITLSAAQGEVCAPANDNAPGQIVISGHKTAVERAIALAKAQGKKAIVLNVSAPFHCALMQPAAQRMAQALQEETIIAPFVPLMANVSAALVHEPQQIKENLVAQVTAPVRWRESVLSLQALGVTHFVEVGTGKILSGMVKRIVPDAQTMALETPEDIDAFIKNV